MRRILSRIDQDGRTVIYSKRRARSRSDFMTRAVRDLIVQYRDCRNPQERQAIKTRLEQALVSERRQRLEQIEQRLQRGGPANVAFLQRQRQAITAELETIDAAVEAENLIKRALRDPGPGI